MARFFLEAGQPNDGQIIITQADAHHIKNVLRLQPGSDIECVDERGLVHLVEITEVGDLVRGRVYDTQELSQESPLYLTLFQGLAKGDKMDLVIQKAVELGAMEIVPFTSRYTVVKLDSKQAEKRKTRWERIALEAAKQSGRTVIPSIGELCRFKDLISEVVKRKEQGELILVAYEGENRTKMGDFGEKHEKISVLIGPEGGFSAEEIEKLVKIGCHTVSLGPRILRTETAGLVVLCLLGYKWGDLK